MAGHSPLSGAKLNNMWRCTSTNPYDFLACTDVSLPTIYIHKGTRRRSWLMHYATSRKVARSIPDGVTGIFHSHNPSARTMALGSTQPLTEMSKGKGKGVPQQAEVAQGVPGSLRPRIILTFRHYKGGRSSAKRTDRL